jgi:3',5'-cyclic AMP phosphodiesterase CpdA
VVRIAHLSDSHLDLTPGRLRRLERVLDEVMALGDVAAVVVSGDIADHGLAEEYAQFFAAIPPSLPAVVVPGNHDLREPMSAFASPDGAGCLNAVVEAAGLSLVGLDSLVEGEIWGLLSDTTLQFAQDAIAAATGEVVLTLHHPPVPVGHHLMDQHGLRNAGALADIVREDDRVVAVLTGHVHTALATTFAGRPLAGAPGIVSTMRLGSRTDPIADDTASPGLALHSVDGRGLTTIFHYLSPEGTA